MRPRKKHSSLILAGLLLPACLDNDNNFVTEAETMSTESDSGYTPPTSGETDDSFCGDGDVGEDEECDDGLKGNGPEKPCLADCTKNKCGDGYKNPDEECDDGNILDGDGCSSACKLSCDDRNPSCAAPETVENCPAQCSICGDGKVTGNEQCDCGTTDDQNPTCKHPNKTEWPSMPPPGACSLECTIQWCGDYTPNNGEECDNGVNNDNGYSPSPPKSATACAAGCKSVKFCGDGGALDAGEACDDGNTDDNDACPSGEGACKAPAMCGDGFVQKMSPEECDDKNTNNIDTCSNTCKRPRVVFLTSKPYTGNLGGLSGADQECQKLAMAATLNGNFRAWLSDETGSPMSRFDNSFDGVYKTTKGTIVTEDGWSGLKDGTLNSEIRYSESGSEILVNVWTNTSVDGSAISTEVNCMNWSSAAPTTDREKVTYGYSGDSGGKWTDADTASCSALNSLYCFEDI